MPWFRRQRCLKGYCQRGFDGGITWFGKIRQNLRIAELFKKLVPYQLGRQTCLPAQWELVGTGNCSELHQCRRQRDMNQWVRTREAESCRGREVPKLMRKR
uniref:Uncharacterized protein n=1 Tax=Trichuris muris TaxID=70415 RepID=A0A5S6QLM4_TRIMR